MDFYGKKTSIGVNTGEYLPKDGFRHLPAANFRDIRGLRQTLLHEAIGHYGTFTFTENQKRDLLTAIGGSGEHISLKEDWAESQSKRGQHRQPGQRGFASGQDRALERYSVDAERYAGQPARSRRGPGAASSCYWRAGLWFPVFFPKKQR